MEAAKKSNFLVATKRGDKGLANKKKELFMLYIKAILRLKKVPFATKLEEEGGKALVAIPLTKNDFFAVSLSILYHFPIEGNFLLYHVHSSVLPLCLMVCVFFYLYLVL